MQRIGAPPPPPLCLPIEHMHGYWTEPPHSGYITGKAQMKPRQFLRGKLNASASWEPYSGCSVPIRGPANRVLENLQQRNVTLVFSGNSIMRHVFFRFASYLRGEAKDEFTQDARQTEKDLCSKDVDLPTADVPASLSRGGRAGGKHGGSSNHRRDGGSSGSGDSASVGGSLQQALGEAGKFRKPFCKNGCCGVCSCASTVGGLTIYFVWQQVCVEACSAAAAPCCRTTLLSYSPLCDAALRVEMLLPLRQEWYDARMRRVWDEMFASPPLAGRQSYLIMNAGLVHARQESLQCILGYQFPLLREYLISGLRRSVRTIYLASPPVQGEEADGWLGAQDGMLQNLFAAMPFESRPVWLDARAALSDWVDFIDVNHFGGRSAQVVLEGLFHTILHWEALYSPGSRGRSYERRRTKRLNKYDPGPSSDTWLQKVHKELDEGMRLRVSPPPAHSKREDCYR